MADLGNLVVSLEANMARFNQNMEDASRRTEQSMSRMQSAANVAKAAIGALAGVATVGILAALVKGAADAADNLRDMSQKTGIAVEDLNGLGFAAGQAGGNLESMVAAAGKLNKSIVDAGGGGKETGAAFKALGIDVRDAEGQLKKADVVMAEIADQFAKYADGPEKAALATALFGKAGADMIPLLNDGGAALRENTEYAKRYSGMTTNLADMSDEFNDIMGKLTVQQNSFGNVLAEAVLPAVNAVAEEILGATENTDKFTIASTAIRTVLETFLVVGSEVAYTFKMVGDEIGGTAAQLAALATLDIKQFTAIGDAMKEDQARALVEHEAFIKKILDRTPKIAVPGSPDAPKPAAPTVPGTATPKARTNGKSDEERALEEATRLISKLKEQSEAYGLTGAALLSYQLQSSKMPEAYKQQALALQTTIDTLKAEEEATKRRDERIKKEAEQAAIATQQNAANVEQIRVGLLSEAQAEEEFFNARLQALQTYHNDRLSSEAEFDAMVEAEAKRHADAKAYLKQSGEDQILNITEDSAGQLYDALRSAGMEQTALAKAAFLAQKAIAIQKIITSTQVGAAAALEFGPIAGPILAGIITGMGYASAGIVAGQAIASAEGGFDIPSGENPVTQLHEREMVLPKAQADVIRGLASGGRAGGGFNFSLINNGTPQRVVEQREIAPGEWAMIVEDAVAATAAQMADPNSKVSRSMSRNFNAPRSRG